MYISCMHITCKAPAKVNLYLEITEKRDNGYHDIVSIMQMVSLFDVISVRSLKRTTGFDIEGNFPFHKTENTIWKAFNVFQKRFGLKCGLKVSVQKRIPIGAGLGGGSSDAASILCCLNLLLERPLHEEDLRRIGLEVGSDVPFFFGSAAALVTGRGEKVAPLRSRSDFKVVLVYPGFPIITRKAYEWYDGVRDNNAEELSNPLLSMKGPKELSTEYETADVPSWSFKNSFEGVVYQKFPELAEIRSSLREMGAVHCGVSGSGSTIMGVFPLDSNLDDVVHTLSLRYPFVAAVEPLERKPDPVLQ
jgi:4-diphosphocytidyl-2-C-methyl-D-erythritol kinase